MVKKWVPYHMHEMSEDYRKFMCTLVRCSDCSATDCRPGGNTDFSRRESQKGGLQVVLHKEDTAEDDWNPWRSHTSPTAVCRCDVFSQRHLQPSEHSGAKEEDEEETLCAAESGGFPSKSPRVERPDVGSQSLGGYVRSLMTSSLLLSQCLLF